MPNPNIELLKNVAKRLGPLLNEVVFVGGCTTGLFITDNAGAETRPTFDVDVIAEITSYADYATFSERLRAIGFREDTSEGAPVCRWLIDGMKLDIMPIDEKILGFSNRWYRDAMDAAHEVELEPDLRIRLISAPYFIATKLEAFRSRGRGDYTNSHDLEDLLTVVDGRVEIVAEVASTGELRSYISEQFRTLLGIPAFIDALPGYLLPDAGSQSRLPILLNRLKEVAASPPDD
jgi:predicted nucleotidyltransferase